MGTASTFPNFLNSIAFHSMTGSPASPPMFPNHNTADQSLMIATLFDFQVYVYAFVWSFAIARHGAATQGV